MRNVECGMLNVEYGMLRRIHHSSFIIYHSLGASTCGSRRPRCPRCPQANNKNCAFPGKQIADGGLLYDDIAQTKSSERLSSIPQRFSLPCKLVIMLFALVAFC